MLDVFGEGGRGGEEVVERWCGGFSPYRYLDGVGCECFQNEVVVMLVDVMIDGIVDVVVVVVVAVVVVVVVSKHPLTH